MTYSRENDPDLQPPKSKAEARRNLQKDSTEANNLNSMLGGKIKPSSDPYYKDHHKNKGGKR